MSVATEPHDRFVIGVDFGTLSGRALVVRVRDGAEVGTAVHAYRSGVMDSVLAADGRALPADWALQDPDDYREVLRHAVPSALAASGVAADQVIGIGIDFTACTVLPTLADGTPLCELPELRTRPHAYVKLWKHHAAQPQADRINALAHQRGEPWIGRYGGKVSAEWQYAKALQLLEEDPEVYARAERWIEAADWIVWQLCGAETRNVCTAGYKGLRQDGHYPSRDYLAALNPGFADFVQKIDGSAGGVRRSRRRADRTGRGVDRPARGHRRGGRQRGRPRHRRGRAGPRAGPAGRHHGHLHLPRGQRHRGGRGCRHVRRGRRRYQRRLLGIRGRPERRG